MARITCIGGLFAVLLVCALALPAVAAPGDVTTTDGNAGYKVKTDYGGGGTKKGVAGTETLHWNANGTWSCMDASGTWGGTGSTMWADLSGGTKTTLITNVLGATSTYSTRPSESKVKYKAPAADKGGSIAFKISFRTHTTVYKDGEPEEGHIEVTYLAKYNIPAAAAPPADISMPAQTNYSARLNVIDPSTGKKVKLGRNFDIGTLHWNQDGTFTSGAIQDGTWVKGPDGTTTAAVSAADVARILGRLGLGGSVTGVGTGQTKVQVTEDRGKVQLKIPAEVDIGFTIAPIIVKIKIRGVNP